MFDLYARLSLAKVEIPQYFRQFLLGVSDVPFPSHPIITYLSEQRVGGRPIGLNTPALIAGEVRRDEEVAPELPAQTEWANLGKKWQGPCH